MEMGTSAGPGLGQECVVRQRTQASAGRVFLEVLDPAQGRGLPRMEGAGPGWGAEAKGERAGVTQGGGESKGEWGRRRRNREAGRERVSH